MIHALALLASIAFVPLDDRPVTAQLPEMLGTIAGVKVEEPPRELLGRYLIPGRPDAIVAWLNQRAAEPKTGAFVVSSDMLAYGGLVASRVPGATYSDAFYRLRTLRRIRELRPGAPIDAFGTVMRLAPTGVPATSGFFAAYPAWTYLQKYANLHDPPLPSEEAAAASLRQSMGDELLNAYLQTRARNYGVDALLLQLTSERIIDRLVLGQDDAGAVGLHVKEVAALQDYVAQQNLGPRVSIEPGADELGMALVARALARNARWTPRIAVRYSNDTGASFRDPLEFAPISAAISGLIDLCGGTQTAGNPDILLVVRLPHATPAEDDATYAAIDAAERAGTPVALADLSYLQSYEAQAAFAERLLASGAATKLDAYASWNTNANTVGTALAEAVAAGAGRRTNAYDPLAHRTFTFMRFLDDYAFHDRVRGGLNALLESQGVDRTALQPGVAATISERNRALLWNLAGGVLAQLYPGYHIAAIEISLPWDRTFETRVDVGIAPNL